jgi:uncharacterized membrane protein YtjA (UPF0391 family)
MRHEKCESTPKKGLIWRQTDAGVQRVIPYQSPPSTKEQAMFRTALGLGVVFLVIALIAGLFGFIGVGTLAWEGAKIFFFIFLVLAVLAFLGGFFTRRWST